MLPTTIRERVDSELGNRMDEASCSEVEVRAVTNADLPAVAAFIEPFVSEGKLLPRTREELVELIPHGFVATLCGRVVGFVALEVYSRKLAEVRSLAVSSEFRRQGVGRLLVDRCVERARELGILEVMAITSSEEFFLTCGFDFTLPGEKKALFKAICLPKPGEKSHDG